MSSLRLFLILVLIPGLIPGGAFARQYSSVSGKITGSDGKPVADVSVHVKGTRIGAVTDMGGAYEIQLPAGDYRLEISHVGFKKADKIISIGFKALVNGDFQLSPSIFSIEQVVVTGSRGAAIMIDHMTPPFDKAGLNPELRELKDLISEHNAAHEKSPTLAETKIDRINQIAVKTGLVKDMGLDSISTHEQIHELEHYIEEIAEKQSPFGLHTFGLSPEDDYIGKTAAMASVEKNLGDPERAELVADFRDRIERSGSAELDAFIDALNGRYIPATKGGDPLRNPNSLPTGKNFYAFDPSRIP